MREFLLMSVALGIAGCASQAVRCDGALQPINPPAAAHEIPPGSAPTRTSTPGSAPTPVQDDRKDAGSQELP